jgi:hypothetical protein
LTIAAADSFVPDFHGDQDQALYGMEDGGTGKPAHLFWQSWFSALPGNSVARTSVDYPLMIAGVFSQHLSL